MTGTAEALPRWAMRERLDVADLRCRRLYRLMADQGVGHGTTAERRAPLRALPGVACDFRFVAFWLARLLGLSRGRGFPISGTEGNERRLCFQGKCCPGDGDTPVAVEPVRLDEALGRGLDGTPVLIECQQTALEYVRFLPEPACRLYQRVLLHVAADLLVAYPRKEKNALTRRHVQSSRLEEELHRLLHLLNAALRT